MIEKEVVRIKNILRRLFGENEKEKKGVKTFTVKEFFRDIEDFIRPNITEKNIDLHTEIKEHISLSFDQDLLRQVVLNLILNAIEAMPTGGTLSILCENQTSRNTLYAMFMITDSGLGIPKSDLTRIFEPFFSTKRDRANRGLGLTLSRDIVEQLGGFIEVESTPERGSSFRVYLPAKQAAPHV
jgi:signal transduction histidine kinase